MQNLIGTDSLASASEIQTLRTSQPRRVWVCNVEREDWILNRRLYRNRWRIQRLAPIEAISLRTRGCFYLAETDSSTAMTPLQSAACTYRVTFVPRAGQKVLSLQGPQR